MATETGIKITASETVSKAAKKAATGLKKVADKAESATPQMDKLRNASRKVGMALGKVGAIAMTAAKTIGSILVGGIMAAVGAFALIGGLLRSMRESTDRLSESIGGGAGLTDVLRGATNDTEELTGAMSGIADVAESAVVTLGAIGAVGKGFIQRSGATVGRVIDNIKEAADAAKASMDGANAAVGGATVKLSDFAAALDRIGAALQSAKDRVFSAFALALTPALEKFADVLESPQFQEFVDMLAVDFYDAGVKLSDWLIETAIPAFQDWMDDVKEAGGLPEWLGDQWEKFKTTLGRIMRLVTEIITNPTRVIATAFAVMFRSLSDSTGIGTDTIKQQFLDLGDTLQIIFSVLVESLGRVLTGPLETLRDLAVSIFDIIADGLDNLPSWFLRLIFGDNDALSVETPSGLKRGVTPAGATGGGGGDIVLNVQVIAPPGTNPAAFGEAVGDGAMRAMRRRGIKSPTMA